MLLGGFVDELPSDGYIEAYLVESREYLPGQPIPQNTYIVSKLYLADCTSPRAGITYAESSDTLLCERRIEHSFLAKLLHQSHSAAENSGLNVFAEDDSLWVGRQRSAVFRSPVRSQLTLMHL